MKCTVQNGTRLHAILGQINAFHTKAPYCLSSTSVSFSQFGPDILSVVFPSGFRLIFFRHFFSNCKHYKSNPSYSGFGGAEVACWPLIPKFAGSNPAEAVGFLKGDKKSSARLPGCISQAPFGHHFSPIVPPLAARGLPRVVDARGTWRPE